MSNLEGTMIVIVIAIVILGSIGYAVALRTSEEEHTITVKDKWVKYQNEKAKYLISDINNNVYSIEDSWLFFTFDASDRYSQIEIGKTYNVKTIGWRVRILSWYKNIIEIGNLK